MPRVGFEPTIPVFGRALSVIIIFPLSLLFNGVVGSEIIFSFGRKTEHRGKLSP
jgi:hypothetical protein